MLGPFTTASRLTPIHQVSLAVLSRAACASMSTTTATTTTTRDRGDRYGPMEWAQLAQAKYIARCAGMSSGLKNASVLLHDLNARLGENCSVKITTGMSQ